jgi:diphthine-ammonia ligase
MHQVFVSWSGGKDSSLACYRAVQNGLKVRYLLNMINEDGKRSRSHGLYIDTLQLQSQALDFPLVQRRASWDDYEAEFKKALQEFKEKGIDGGIFGDIELEEHRQWVERVCQETGITPYLPLWGLPQDKIVRDFIDLGFEAIVVTTRADILGEEWLGRKIDRDFLKQIDEMGKIKGVTPCGEAGEYHTFVVDGPLFKKRIVTLENKNTFINGYWFLEISKSELKTK